MRAAQRNPELRDAWLYKLSQWMADQLIFIDESTANERTSDRTIGWAPIGPTPFENKPFKHGEQFSVLPAYTVDGFITWEMRQGSYTAELFEEFIVNNVLPRCNAYPGPRSVIVLDNALIHRAEVHIHSLVV